MASDRGSSVATSICMDKYVRWMVRAVGELQGDERVMVWETLCVQSKGLMLAEAMALKEEGTREPFVTVYF